jgi:hypothetical protein
MIRNWNVLQYVSKRYGIIEPVFTDAAKRLELAKTDKSQLPELENDQKRITWRIARETALPDHALERIFQTVDFQDKYILDILSEKAVSVCRILNDGAPLGTGFLVAGNIILTNNHVIENSQSAQSMFAEFNYELDQTQVPRQSKLFKINPDVFFLTSSLVKDEGIPFSGLDFTLIGLDAKGTRGEDISELKAAHLDGNVGKIVKGEYCVIIQHPNGLPKKVVLKNSAFFSETDTRILYETDTLPGSSGSMVVGLGTGEVIALHHSGLARTDDQNRPLTKAGIPATPATPDDQFDWIANEGIKISQIAEALEGAELPQQMEAGRKALLSKTIAMRQRLQATINTNENKEPPPSPEPPQDRQTMPDVPTPSSPGMSNPTPSRMHYIIAVQYDDAILDSIKSVLNIRYGGNAQLLLSMPANAQKGSLELFSLSLPASKDPESEARSLLEIPGISYAETDASLRLNVTRMATTSPKASSRAEESLLWEDGYSVNNELDFLKKYEGKSDFIDDQNLSKTRMWNWYATQFDKVINGNPVSPVSEKIRIVQFDTGYTDHAKVSGAFDTDRDFNFIGEGESESDALDPRVAGSFKWPGHGTRTGSLLVGHELALVEMNGNGGLLNRLNYKLVPYRISKSVILIGRQQQLADALDMAIHERFDIITMSMGLPPTLATAIMAKKAYEAGIIWCCAAGNVVQVVIAPACYPGTIAVAASNPCQHDWSGSSRGDAVDITAPGEDVYVPIFIKSEDGQDHGRQGMVYGDGTSYATPHIAAAAAYWLAKYKQELVEKGWDTGWKKVEAFRAALAKSANRKNNLPRYGFGHGILDADKLLETGPDTLGNTLVHQYEGWNENIVLDTIQSYGEMIKTYWNRLHQWIFGMPRGGQESFIAEVRPLSEFSRRLESETFGVAPTMRESILNLSQEDLQDRFNIIVKKIESLSKK